MVLSQSEALANVYKLAWGVQWPRHVGTVHKTDIGIPRDTEYTDADDATADIPDRWDYTCLDNIDLIADALCMPTKTFDFLVIRREYDLLREMIERNSSTGAFVVTGHPGIGS